MTNILTLTTILAIGAVVVGMVGLFLATLFSADL